MLYTLKKKIVFEGQEFTTISLPDEALLKHQRASLRVAKFVASLRKEKLTDADLEVDADDIPSERALEWMEAAQKGDQMMIEAFCEDLPAGAFELMSIKDAKFITEYIVRLMKDEDNAEAGGPPGKKSNPPRRSAS
jgi:hypothetical protein